MDPSSGPQIYEYEYEYEWLNKNEPKNMKVKKQIHEKK